MRYGLLAAGIAAVDLLLKRYAETNLSADEDKEAAGGRILLTKYHNHGAALNVGEKKKEWVLAGSCAIFGALAAVFAMEGRGGKAGAGDGLSGMADAASGSAESGRGGRKLRRFALACLLGGAASNVSDRVRKGYVVDYIRFPFLKRIVWNIGDLFILLGAVLAVVGELFGNGKKEQVR